MSGFCDIFLLSTDVFLPSQLFILCALNQSLLRREKIRAHQPEICEARILNLLHRS